MCEIKSTITNLFDKMLSIRGLCDNGDWLLQKISRTHKYFASYLYFCIHLSNFECNLLSKFIREVLISEISNLVFYIEKKTKKQFTILSKKAPIPITSCETCNKFSSRTSVNISTYFQNKIGWFGKTFILLEYHSNFILIQV